MRLNFKICGVLQFLHKCVTHSDTGVSLILALALVTLCHSFKVRVQFCFSSHLVKTLLSGGLDYSTA